MPWNYTASFMYLLAGDAAAREAHSKLGIFIGS